MQMQTLLLSTLAVLAWGSPAQMDCKQECSTMSNDCEITYVACRTGCGGALDLLPSLTAPACAPSSTAEAVVNTAAVMTDVPADAVPQDVPTATSDPAAIITPAPEDPTLKPGYCSPVWACDDNYIICGGERIPYGGCYDVCKGNTIVVPACTLPPVPEAEPVRGGLTLAQLERMRKNAADRLAAGGDPCLQEDKSRCKPTGW